jgi:hypothetical protein
MSTKDLLANSGGNMEYLVGTIASGVTQLVEHMGSVDKNLGGSH